MDKSYKGNKTTKKILAINISIASMFLASCNLGVNTTDPQMSTDIQNSARDSLLVCEYRLIPSSSIKIHRAWVEYGWRYNVVRFKKVKEKFDVLQLIVEGFDANNKIFKRDRYIYDWRIEDNNRNSFGGADGQYSLHLQSKALPDTFRFIINKLTDLQNPTIADSFQLEKIK